MIEKKEFLHQTTTTSESLSVSKQEFAVNVIGLGYAVEKLSSITSFSKEVWAAEIAIEANRRCDELTKEQIEELIASHYTNEPTNVYSISIVEHDEVDY